MRTRKCGICGGDIPRGVDWPFWKGGNPVHEDCQSLAQVDVKTAADYKNDRFSDLIIMELKEGDTATVNGPAVIVLSTLTERGVAAALLSIDKKNNGT